MITESAAATGKIMDMKGISSTLEQLYQRYTHRRYASDDPVTFLYDYPDVKDREIVALLASSLAYGNVKQIGRSIGSALEIIGGEPRRFVMESGKGALRRSFDGFKHRWTTGGEVAALLLGAKEAIDAYGSLEECFVKGLDPKSEDIVGALTSFVGKLSPLGAEGMLPSPCRGSACKRLNLFLRWMVREDRVDPGGWKGVPRSMLLMPLDTHIYRICTGMGISNRRSADLKTAREITGFFRRISPDDPVKYDFALTRLSMRRDEDEEGVLARLIAGRGAASRAPARP